MNGVKKKTGNKPSRSEKQTVEEMNVSGGRKGATQDMQIAGKKGETDARKRDRAGA